MKHSLPVAARPAEPITGGKDISLLMESNLLFSYELPLGWLQQEERLEGWEHVIYFREPSQAPFQSLTTRQALPSDQEPSPGEDGPIQSSWQIPGQGGCTCSQIDLNRKKDFVKLAENYLT